MLAVLIISLFTLLAFVSFFNPYTKGNQTQVTPKKSHWLVLKRKSGREFLYYGVLGDVNNSRLIKTFQVKSGSSSSPTPLPELLGREYWLIIKKESSADNPETAPYFLTLDVPVTEDWPFGPVPYEECDGPASTATRFAESRRERGEQCDWVLPGYFGLHGVNGNLSKLDKTDPGSSGCIRHRDEDILYLYNLLTPEKEEIRYYIEDI